MPKEQESHKTLFDAEEFQKYNKEWQQMPEFNQEDLSPHQSVIVHFENKEDVKAFAKLIEQNITPRTKSIWFPKADQDIVKNLRWIAAKKKAK